MLKKKYNHGLLISLMSLLVVLNLCSCGQDDNDKCKKDGAKSKVEQTRISYKINLDESKKIKEEGNKVYYVVPVNTQVIITATVVGPEKVGIAWSQTITKLTGTMPISDDTTWEYSPKNPSNIAVCGKPSRISKVNGVDLIVNEEKKFIISWQ